MQELSINNLGQMFGFTPIELGILLLVAYGVVWAFRRQITVRGVLRWASLFLFLTAMAIATLGSVLFLGSNKSIADSIAKSRWIETSFHEAAKFVEEFRKEHSCFPSRAEFDEWCSTHNKGRLLWIEAPPRSPEGIAKLGKPTADGYLLVYWRGEWHEYFASWSKASTLVFDPSRYYQFGGPLQDMAACIAFASVVSVAGAVLWRWS